MGKGKDGTMQYTRKTSGLDMVRRDWCPISKEVSGYVLDRLLSGMNREDVVEQVHTYLREKSEKVTVRTCALVNAPRKLCDTFASAGLELTLSSAPCNDGCASHVPARRRSLGRAS
eukprot:SAG11_NODE_802_length_7105_cov_1.831573_6_plen_116_part_00